MDNVTEALMEMVGSVIDDGAVTRIVDMLNDSPTRKEFIEDDAVYYQFYSSGVSLLVNTITTCLQTVFLFPADSDDEDFREYKFELPGGLRWSDSSERVIENMGTPTRSATRWQAFGDKALKDLHGYVSYGVGKKKLHFEFSPHNTIQLVTIMML